MTAPTIRSSIVLLLGLAASSALAGEGGILFERITSGLAHGVSDDGTIVVGEYSGGGAFIWTPQSITGIGGTAAIAASGDGTLIVGDLFDAGGNSAGRHEAGDGWIAFGGLGSSGCDSSLSSAYDIASDGQRCVGLGWDGCSAGAFLWTRNEGMRALPQLGPFSSRADTISGDGSVIGGWDEASNGGRRAAAWQETPGSAVWQETLVLEGTSGNTEGYGEVNGSNGDGSILVGSAQGSSDSTSGAFVIRADDGLQLLGLLPTGAVATGGALDVTEDGRAVVGFQREGFGGAQVFTATYWSAKTGLVALKDHLNELGANIPAGFTLAAAMSMSDDGRVICGWGYEGLFFFQEAWVVVLPGGPDACPADFNGDGVVDGADLNTLLGAWGTLAPELDLTGDGRIDGADLLELLSAWGPCA
jgi:uncharacterized membrane protein